MRGAFGHVVRPSSSIRALPKKHMFSAVYGNEAEATCSFCRAPERQLWPPDSRQDGLQTEQRGDWMLLDRCPNCGWLWCRVPYEPYASFSYAVLWRHTDGDWQHVYDADDGETLHQWHKATVQRRAASLSAEDQAKLEHHRDRSGGRTPVDGARVPKPDLMEILGTP